MDKIFMLLLAFTVTEPSGVDRDEIVHILSRHFDTEVDCQHFIMDWKDTIETQGVDTVQGMLAEGWKIKLDHVGCTEEPNLKKVDMRFCARQNLCENPMKQKSNE